ncbi:CS domain [Dillenia turbinata]|uniref:Co-chaperone protein p23 n=1 Tax=Dillenia turbinata TaxID=194707 RepID=A0AAN8VWI0_9MAGN
MQKISRHPEVKWAQREDKIYITVLLPDSKNAKVNVDPDGVFTFSANAGAENIPYELKLNLLNKINVEESKINIGVRSIFCVLEKAEKGWWKKLLRGDEKVPHYVKVDWDKWVDEDDDSGPADLDLGGMDFSKFGGMDDAMGEDLDDSDDDDQEVSKPEEQSSGKEGEKLVVEKDEDAGAKVEAA